MPARPNLALPEHIYFQSGKHAELLDRLTTAKIGNAFELAAAVVIFWESSGLIITISERPDVSIKKNVNVLQPHVGRILQETPTTDESSRMVKNTYDVTTIVFKEFEKALANYFNDPDTDKKIVKFAEFQAEFRRFLRQQYEKGKRYRPERPSGEVKKPAETARNET